MSTQSRVDAAVRAACPNVESIRFGNIADRSTWSIQFTASATQQQIDAANAAMAAVPYADSADDLADDAVSKIDRLQFEVAFDMENRMRVRESKAAITRAQYRSALIAAFKAMP